MPWRLERTIAKIKLKTRALNNYVIRPSRHSWLIPMVFDISSRFTPAPQVQRQRHGSFPRPFRQRFPWWWRWALHFHGKGSRGILRENHIVPTPTHQCYGQRIDCQSSRGFDQETTWIWTLIFALPLSQDRTYSPIFHNWLILQNSESFGWSSVCWRLSVLARLHFPICVFQGDHQEEERQRFHSWRSKTSLGHSCLP